MTITRIIDGKTHEITLTDDELYQAYNEKEWLYAIDNITVNMKNYLSADEYEILKDNNDFLEEAARLLIKNSDDGDMSLECALEDAINEAKENYIRA